MQRLSDYYPRPTFAHQRPNFVPRPRLNFSHPQASLLLSQALLWHHFGLKMMVPVGNLTPVVPRSLNYLQWVRRLQRATLTTHLSDSDLNTTANATATKASTSTFRVTSSSHSRFAVAVVESAKSAYLSSSFSPPSSSSSLQFGELAEALLDCAAPRPHVLDIGTGATAVLLLMVHRLYAYTGVGSDCDSASIDSANLNIKQNSTAMSNFHNNVACGDRVCAVFNADSSKILTA